MHGIWVNQTSCLEPEEVERRLGADAFARQNQVLVLVSAETQEDAARRIAKLVALDLGEATPVKTNVRLQWTRPLTDLEVKQEQEFWFDPAIQTAGELIGNYEIQFRLAMNACNSELSQERMKRYLLAMKAEFVRRPDVDKNAQDIDWNFLHCD